MEFLEHANAFRLATSGCLILLLLRYLRSGFADWRRLPQYQLAGALTVYLASEIVLRTVGWLWIRAINDGETFQMSNFLLYLCGTATLIAAASAAWLIRVISPPSCRNWGWIVALTFALLFVGIMNYAEIPWVSTSTNSDNSPSSPR